MADPHLYEIQSTRKEQSRHGTGIYTRNCSDTYLTTSVARALQLHTEKWPDAEVHQVIQRDRYGSMTVDPWITKAFSAEG